MSSDGRLEPQHYVGAIYNEQSCEYGLVAAFVLVRFKILLPLAERFMSTAETFLAGGQEHLASDLADLLECFSGIAKAAQIESGNTLYSELKKRSR